VFCPGCGRQNVAEAQFCAFSGSVQLSDLAGGGQPGNSVDPQVVDASGDSSYGLSVPDPNPDAVTAFYLAIASFIPLLGIVSGLLAVRTGVRGLRACAANPSVRGKKHSLFGIFVGGLLALV
jgi:hypothetical protein